MGRDWWLTLGAVGLALVTVAGCNTGGHDDLVPTTSRCFPYGEADPSVSARFVAAPAGQQAPETRFAQVTVSFAHGDVRLNNASAREAGGSAASLEVVNQVARTGAYDMLVRVPDRVKDFGMKVSAACGTGTGTLDISAIIEIDGNIQASVYAE